MNEEQRFWTPDQDGYGSGPFDTIGPSGMTVDALLLGRIIEAAERATSLFFQDDLGPETEIAMRRLSELLKKIDAHRAGAL